MADLMNRPADGRQVIGWLPGDVFTTPATVQLYELISGLLDQGDPVDSLLVAWQASQLIRTAGPRGPEPPLSPQDVLRIAAADTPPGTAATFGRGLFADRVCAVKLGPDWITKRGLTRAGGTRASSPPADQQPRTAVVPVDALAGQKAAPVRFQQPHPGDPHPQTPAPVPGL